MNTFLTAALLFVAGCFAMQVAHDVDDMTAAAAQSQY
jgi:hypothetical protein